MRLKLALSFTPPQRKTQTEWRWWRNEHRIERKDSRCLAEHLLSNNPPAECMAWYAVGVAIDLSLENQKRNASFVPLLCSGFFSVRRWCCCSSYTNRTWNNKNNNDNNSTSKLKMSWTAALNRISQARKRVNWTSDEVEIHAVKCDTFFGLVSVAGCGTSLTVACRLCYKWLNWRRSERWWWVLWWTGAGRGSVGQRCMVGRSWWSYHM